ncbi:MAG: thioredoxin family protein [Cyclobacteriaceae bacterium]
MSSQLKNIIRSASANSMSPISYNELLKSHAEEGKTTGPNPHEDLVYYTKLNAQRSKRIYKTIALNESLVSKIESISTPQTWILITESWCGDAANSVPIISSLADINPKIELQIVLRDSNDELMSEFLTNGGKSIPKLIALDEDTNVLFTWGPRPKEAQDLYDTWKNSENKVPYKEFQIEMQKWYNKDKGQSLQEELKIALNTNELQYH